MLTVEKDATTNSWRDVIDRQSYGAVSYAQPMDGCSARRAVRGIDAECRHPSGPFLFLYTFFG